MSVFVLKIAELVLTYAGHTVQAPPALSPGDVYLGAAVVCAEARGESPRERRLVAGTLRNRTQNRRKPFRTVALAPRQFAKPCPGGAVTQQHYQDFLLGWWGIRMPAWWSPDVEFFQTHRSARYSRWERRGFLRVDAGRAAHRFYVLDRVSQDG